MDKRKRRGNIFWEIFLTENVYLISIICPGCPFHGTVLNIEREVFNIDVTRALVNPVAEPSHHPIVAYNHVGIDH